MQEKDSFSTEIPIESEKLAGPHILESRSVAMKKRIDPKTGTMKGDLKESNIQSDMKESSLSRHAKFKISKQSTLRKEEDIESEYDEVFQRQESSKVDRFIEKASSHLMKESL